MRSQSSNRKCLLELFQRRSKVLQGICQEYTWNFDQFKAFSEHYKPIRGFVYEITEFICHLRYFSEFIQKYPTSLVKISISTRKLLVILSHFFFCELKSRELAPCKLSHIGCCGFNYILSISFNYIYIPKRKICFVLFTQALRFPRSTSISCFTCNNSKKLSTFVMNKMSQIWLNSSIIE